MRSPQPLNATVMRTPAAQRGEMTRTFSTWSRAVVGLALVASAVAASCTHVRHAQSADGRAVTRTMVRAVEIGMSERQVLAILGAGREAGRAFLPNGRTLTYGGPDPLSVSYTVLWVHLSEADQVRMVYAKLYETWNLDSEWGVFERHETSTWEGSPFLKAKFPD